jgi:hypothetical protein
MGDAMAILNIHGRLVVESAGPIWHLSGIVKRDRKKWNRLVLTRTADPLSRDIKAASGQLLSAVQITDRAGRSAKLINVRISAASDLEPVFDNPRENHGSTSDTSTYEDDEVRFTFQAINIENIVGSTSSSDDWTSSGG